MAIYERKTIDVLNGKVKVGDRVQFLFQGTWYDDGRVHKFSHTGHGEVQVKSGNGAIYYKTPKEVMKCR